MSDLPPIDPPEAETSGVDLPDMAAGELALGVLEGDERAHALRRVLMEPDFASAVEQWRVNLAQLFDLWPSVAAPEGVFARIERSIDLPASLIEGRSRISRLWPAATLILSVACAALLVIVLDRPSQVPTAVRPAARSAAIAGATPRMLVAAIDPLAKGTPVTAIYDPTSGRLRLTAATLASGGRSAELWVIAGAGDKIPHSLGLLHVGGNTSVIVSPANRSRLTVGAALAVSIEPIGGSRTGLPTGPVVATGALSQV